MTKQSQLLAPTPRTTLATISFLDIVGFSVTVTKLRPREVFAILKDFIDMLSGIIHHHDGIVDKILGDGILYYFPGRGSSPQHAINALKCAVAIHRQTFLFNQKICRKSGIIFPLRIGINSANIYSGGLDLKMGMTNYIVGEGVNFAKRLEEACLTDHVLLSPITHELLSGQADELRKYVLNIKIKHSKDLFQAYGIDPFTPDEKKAILAMKFELRKMDSIWRKEARISLNDRKIRIFANGFLGEIRDFSKSGLQVLLPECFGSGVEVEVYMGQMDSEIRKILTRLNLQPLQYQVKWCAEAKDDSYLHGLDLISLNEMHRNFLYEVFESHQQGVLSSESFLQESP